MEIHTDGSHYRRSLWNHVDLIISGYWKRKQIRRRSRGLARAIDISRSTLTQYGGIEMDFHTYLELFQLSRELFDKYQILTFYKKMPFDGKVVWKIFPRNYEAKLLTRFSNWQASNGIRRFQVFFARKNKTSTTSWFQHQVAWATNAISKWKVVRPNHPVAIMFGSFSKSKKIACLRIYALSRTVKSKLIFWFIAQN